MNITNHIKNLVIMAIFSLSLFADASENEAMKAGLRKEVERFQSEMATIAALHQEQLSALEVARSSLNEIVQELRRKKRSLESSVLRLQSAPTPEPIEWVDTILFKSGRSIVCKVVSYSNRQFTLEDRLGKQIQVSQEALTGIDFRKEGKSEVFPELASRAPRPAPRALPTMPTSHANKPFELKEHMVTTRVIRKRSSESIDEIRGYVDEVAENVQFTCRIEARALPGDVKGLKMKLWVFGVSTTNEKSLKLIISSQMIFDLDRLGKLEFDTNEVVLKYDDRGAKYGDKLYGWVFVLEDSKGNVVHLKRSKKALADNLDKIRRMSVNERMRL
jgi:hypothetical protein